MNTRFKPFALGKIVMTPGAMDALAQPENAATDAFRLLARHGRGDWGDMDAHDKQANDQATHDGTRVFSAYDLPAGRVWVITEADRSSTCILLPEEY